MGRKLILVMALMLCMTGCGRETGRKSTVIYIPARPRQPVQTVSEHVTAPTVSKPEITVPEETVPEATSAAKIQKSGSTKKNTAKPAGTGGSAQISATEKPTVSKPVETKPAETKPVETEPPETKPAETQPASMEPAETEPPVTEPIVTEPPITEPPETEPPMYDISGYTVGDFEFEMLDRINEYRAEAGLEELYLDTYLSAIASCRSYEATLVWSHTRPDGRGYATVLSDYGYWAGHAKELLAYGSGSGDGGAMVEKWMNSDSHRESLLSDVSTVGIGIYRANGYTYVTCLLVE